MSFNGREFIIAFEQDKISKLMNYYHSFFNYIFPLYHAMLKHYYYSFYRELFFLILEYINLLIFLLSKPVSNTYNFTKIVHSYMEFKSHY